MKLTIGVVVVVVLGVVLGVVVASPSWVLGFAAAPPGPLGIRRWKIKISRLRD